MLGTALAARLGAVGELVVTTTRRRSDAAEKALYLDLAADPTTWQWPREVAVAYLCAGVTRIENCENDPARSKRVNVSGIGALAECLVAAGVFVIYLSTNQVFDGSVPHQLPEAPHSPTTEYGRQKAAAERRLLALSDSVSVVRFTKIFARKTPLIMRWREALERGEAVRPFSDLVMAPVPVQFCVDVLQRVGQDRASGITQVSAAQDVSYAEAARYIGQRLGSAPDLVQPHRSDEAGIFLGPPRAHTTLDTTRIRHDFGSEVPDVWETIDYAMGAATWA